MNHRPSHLKVQKNKQRFTLVETVLAMGIITIMITAFLAAFAPAVQGIKKSISAKEANRLVSTLEYELSVLRPNEVAEVADGGQEGKYKTSFEKAYNWIKVSGGINKEDAILLYQYRGDLNPEQNTAENDDGTLPPYTEGNGIPSEDYVLMSVVRRFGEEASQSRARITSELKPGVVEGRVFYVRMVQLIFVDGELNKRELKIAGEDKAPGGAGKIIDPEDPHSEVTDSSDYPEAVITFQVQVYVLKSNQYAYISSPSFDLTKDNNNDGIPDILGKPIFTRNMAVRR